MKNSLPKMRWCFSPKTVMGQCNSSLSQCVENCPVPPRIENRCPSLCSWKMLSIPAVYADCWHHFLLRASPRDGAVLSQCMVNVEHTRLTNSIYTDVKLGTKRPFVHAVVNSSFCFLSRCCRCYWCRVAPCAASLVFQLSS